MNEINNNIRPVCDILYSHFKESWKISNAHLNGFLNSQQQQNLDTDIKFGYGDGPNPCRVKSRS